MTRAHVEVHLIMTVEEAEAVRDRLADHDNTKTDSAYFALDNVLATVKS
jgi:hypothetical protein